MKAITDFVRILEIKRYSRQTIDSYKSNLQLLEVHYHPQQLSELSDQQLIQFIYHLVHTKQISSSYQRQFVGAIKLFYRELLNRQVPLEFLQVARKENKLPVVLSEWEVAAILENTKNIKHKAIISLLYSAGLRVGELLALKKTDIDSKRMCIFIRQAKGKKDRYTLLSVKLLELLREYYKQHKPKVYLFEGQNGGKYSAESINQFIKRSVKRAGIKKAVSAHTFRHSFATHLLERGVGIGHIQKLLGHNNISTTLMYTHIANDNVLSIKSPLDTL